MRLLVLVPVMASLLAACAGAGSSPSPLAPNANATAVPTVSGAPSATPCPTLAPSFAITNEQPTPIHTAIQTASPTPTLKPKTGWPSVMRAGITMTSDASDLAGPMDGSLRLPITLTGLKAGDAITIAAAGTYHVKWICGTMPEPCGELGCGHAFEKVADGSAKSTSTAVAAGDGIAILGVELAALPPSGTCPADSSAPWATQWERWTKVRITERVHGLRLRPDVIFYGWTY